MSVTDLASERWARNTLPSQHTLRDMLVEAIRKLDAGEVEADHMILCYGGLDSGEMMSGFMQAGKLDHFAQIGLLSHTQFVLIASAG